MSLDDATVFVGGPTDGLWSASVADVRTGKSQAFRQLNREPVWGLTFTLDGLLAGHDDFAQPPAVPFSVGLSSDGGETFAPRMTVCELSPADCPAGTAAANFCPALFDGVSNFQYDFQSQRCLPPPSRAAADAGTEMRNKDLAARGAGCGCRGAAGARDASPSKLATLLALATAAFLRRRKTQLVRGAAAPPSGDTA
jgi:MYXO-CTERM domain-containing protein